MDLILSRENPPVGTSIQDRIRRAVEEEILSGKRPPGSMIDEKALALGFDVSRTPVREALLMLAARGLVSIAPRAGIYVRKASVSELIATLEALAELEAVLARLAARRATPAQCKDLKQKLAKAAARATASDRKGYEAANAVLHEAIYSCSGNPVLVDQVRGVRKTLAAYRQRGFDKPGRLATSSREHARIVQAISSGDEIAAADAMRVHINVGGEAMAALVMAAEASPMDAAPRMRARRSAATARLAGPKS